jgi:hypothetical protein
MLTIHFISHTASGNYLSKGSINYLVIAIEPNIKLNIITQLLS